MAARLDDQCQYNRETCIEIFTRLMCGESLVKITEHTEDHPNEDMPSYRAFMYWLQGRGIIKPDQTAKEQEKAQIEVDWLRAEYSRARDIGADRRTFDVQDIADESIGMDSNGIQSARLRVDASKWLAERLAPRKYGLKQEITGPDGGPLQISVVNYSDQ